MRLYPHRSRDVLIAGLAPMLLLPAACRSVDHSSSSAIASSTPVARPDPTTRIIIGDTPHLIASERGLDQGLVGSYAVLGTHNQLTVFFEPRSAEPRLKDLAAYSAWADDLLKEREIRPVDLGRVRNPIREAGLPFVAKTYVNVQRPGQPAPTSICDAAGLRFETPGGFWTISCNADRGHVDDAVASITECLRVMTVSRTPASHPVR